MSGYDQFFKNAKDKNSSGKDKGHAHAKSSAQPKFSANSQSKNNSTSQQHLTAEEYLRSALKVKSKSKVQRKVGPPIMSFIALIALVAATGWLYFNPDTVDNALEFVEITAFGQVLAEAKPEQTAQPEAEAAAQNTSGNKNGEQKDCVVQKGFTDEELSHFNKLNERKEELDRRDAELTLLEEELHKQKKEVEDRISRLENIRTEVANALKEKVEVDQQRVSTLVDFYSNMKPKQAADIFGTLNEDLAIEVLSRMKKKNAADIMNLLEAGKARALSEKFTGYKRR